jgi:hypothetical protein
MENKMHSKDKNTPAQKPEELTEHDIQTVAKEAIDLIKKHGFGVAYPALITGTIVVGQIGQYVDAWERP